MTVITEASSDTRLVSFAAGSCTSLQNFFGANGQAHREKVASSGVLSLLFGGGASGQSGFDIDRYSDGKLFMQSRAGDFLKAGGLAIPAGGSGTTTPPPPPPPTGSDSAVYRSNSSSRSAR